MFPREDLLGGFGSFLHDSEALWSEDLLSLWACLECQQSEKRQRERASEREQDGINMQTSSV